MSFLSSIGIYQVPQGHCAILQRFGKFQKVCEPGLHITNPLSCSLKSLQDWTWIRKEGLEKDSQTHRSSKFFGSQTPKKEWTCAKPGNLMELTEQQWTTNPCVCYTNDRVETKIQAILRFRITDPYKAAYAIDVLPNSIHNECHSALRSEIAKYDFGPAWFSNKAKFFQVQDQINQGLRKNLQNRVANWGIEIIQAEIGPFQYSKDDIASIQAKQFVLTALFLTIPTIAANFFRGNIRIGFK